MITSGVTKSESEAVHNSLCCQLTFPWKICTRGEERGGGRAAVLSRRMLALGQYCCREGSGVPEGGSPKLQEKTTLV